MIWRNVYSRPVYRMSNPIWREMRRMQRDMDFLLGGTRGPVSTKFPAINAWKNDDGLVLTAEVPGVDPENIDISVIGETLTLSGSQVMEKLPEGARYFRKERDNNDFSRTFELPFKVDVDAVDAKFHNGILQINLPRVPEEKPKKIEIKFD